MTFSPRHESSNQYRGVLTGAIEPPAGQCPPMHTGALGFRRARRFAQTGLPVALRPVTKLPASHVGALVLAAVSNSSRTVLNISEHYKQLGRFLRVDFLANGSSLFRAWRRGSSSSSRR